MEKLNENKIQNMDCFGCRQSALKCRKCIRKIMEYWEVEDYYTIENKKEFYTKINRE